MLLKNMCHQKRYQHYAGQWSWWSTYVSSTNKLVPTDPQANLSYKKIFLPELSKVNHVIINKKQADQRHFSPKKSIEKRKWIHSPLSTYHSGRWIILQNGITDSSILQRNFSSVSKSISCNREKILGQRWDKKNGAYILVKVALAVPSYNIC